jgi:hypothetical protein
MKAALITLEKMSWSSLAMEWKVTTSSLTNFMCSLVFRQSRVEIQS